MSQLSQPQGESPGHVRLSLAAAMTLGIKPGVFYRNARLHCVNLLLTYSSGCAARCAYCGLSRERSGPYGRKSFIRVSWPTHPLDDVVRRIGQRLHRVKRVCISQITDKRCVEDTRTICRRLRSSFDVPVSLLVSPTLLSRRDLLDYRDAGADKIGVAIDLATPRLFDRYRGRGVGGPHRWEVYWERLAQALKIFGPRNAGAHLMTGMGETEKEMAGIIQRIRDAGGWTHLFSFFPEASSAMSDHPAPAMDHYRRIQIARHLVDNGIRRVEEFAFDEKDRIAHSGLSPKELDAAIDSGEPFRTNGCPGYDGEVARIRAQTELPPKDFREDRACTS